MPLSKKKMLIQSPPSDVRISSKLDCELGSSELPASSLIQQHDYMYLYILPPVKFNLSASGGRDKSRS